MNKISPGLSHPFGKVLSLYSPRFRDNIFTPSHGSREKASKVMVVLTDGDIFGDPLNLTTVIDSTEMQGVERFAIGVRTRCWGYLVTLCSLGWGEARAPRRASVSSLPKPCCTHKHQLLFFQPPCPMHPALPTPLRVFPEDGSFPQWWSQLTRPAVMRRAVDTLGAHRRDVREGSRRSGC